MKYLVVLLAFLLSGCYSTLSSVKTGDEITIQVGQDIVAWQELVGLVGAQPLRRRLIFNGFDGNSMKVGYRESTSLHGQWIARPAFNRELSFSTESNEIQFERFRAAITAINQNSFSLRVIAPPVDVK